MAAKTYNLKVTRGNGVQDTLSFTIPDTIGDYKIKATLSNGSVIENEGTIRVNGKENSYNLKFKLSDGSTIDAGIITTPAVSIPSFADISWDMLAKVCVYDDPRNYFNAGDEKSVEYELITDLTIPLTLVILGFYHDNMDVGGYRKHPITLGLKNISEMKGMNTSGTNNDGWQSSNMRNLLSQEMIYKLPPDLRQYILLTYKNTYVRQNGELKLLTTGDTLFLLSRREVDGTNDTYYRDEGEQYEYWKSVKDGTNPVDRIKTAATQLTRPYTWWLRSQALSNGEDFLAYNTEGNLEEIFASYINGIAFAFCFL